MVMLVVAVAEIGGKFLLSGVGDHLPFSKIFLFNIASLLGIGVMFTLFFAKTLWMMYLLAIGECNEEILPWSRKILAVFFTLIPL